MKEDFKQDTLLRKLIRIAIELKECKEGLEDEYKRVMPLDSSADGNRPCFPDPTSDPPSETAAELKLTYSSRLNRQNESFELRQHRHSQELASLESLRSLFLAKGGHDEQLVVKFTSHYHERAHKVLAELKLAPKLYVCRRVVGKLVMVVMEPAISA